MAGTLLRNPGETVIKEANEFLGVFLKKKFLLIDCFACTPVPASRNTGCYIYC